MRSLLSVACALLSIQLAFAAPRDGFGLSTQIIADGSELIVLHVVVRSIVCGSPAYHAGIHAGDRIVSINGEPVERTKLGRYINELAPKIQEGSKVVSLMLMRGTIAQAPHLAKLQEGPIVEDDVCRNSVRV